MNPPEAGPSEVQIASLIAADHSDVGYLWQSLATPSTEPLRLGRSGPTSQSLDKQRNLVERFINRIKQLWGTIIADDAFQIMAFDVRVGQEYDAGSNAFYISLRGSSTDEIQQRWVALADGATIQQPIGPSAWSPLYGMLTDRFGITWIVDVDPQA